MRIGDEMGLEAEIRQLRTMLNARNDDIEAYRSLCARAADALDSWPLAKLITESKELVKELRKAAQ